MEGARPDLREVVPRHLQLLQPHERGEVGHVLDVAHAQVQVLEVEQSLKGPLGDVLQLLELPRSRRMREGTRLKA